MNTVIQTILTDKNARGVEEIQTLVETQNNFVSWE